MKQTFLLVCIANYCRSPVAMHLLKKKYPNLNFISAGLHPILEPSMDRRSESFLKSKNIKDLQHLPKKINLNMIKKSYKVFALDVLILMKLNALYPTYIKKFSVLNFQKPELTLSDPYRMDEKNYFEVMKNIENVIDSINL